MRVTTPPWASLLVLIGASLFKEATAEGGGPCSTSGQERGGLCKISGGDIEKIYTEHCTGTPGQAECVYTLEITLGWMTYEGYFIATEKPDDGSNRTVKVFNNSFPGPTLVMTEGDSINVTVINTLDEPVTVHWHGLWMRTTPWMDGVPGVSELHVDRNSTFTYWFRVVGEHGTFWYHSHQGLQYADGLYGSLIVRHKPEQHELFFSRDVMADTSYSLTDYATRDLQVLIAGLSDQDANTVASNWRSGGNAHTLPSSVNTLVFGGNVQLMRLDDPYKSGALICNGTDPKDYMHYIVEPCTSAAQACGCRVRFINAGAVVSMQVSIQGHRGRIVEADGPFVQSNFQNDTEYVSLMVAQRYSVVYNCTPPEEDEMNYWIAVGALHGTGKYLNADPVSPRGCAILHYGADTDEVEIPKKPYNFTPPEVCQSGWSFGTNLCSSPCLLTDVNSNAATRCLERHPQEALSVGEPGKECNITVQVNSPHPGGLFEVALDMNCTGDEEVSTPATSYVLPSLPDAPAFSLCLAKRTQQELSQGETSLAAAPLAAVLAGFSNNLIIPFNYTIYVTLESTKPSSKSVHPWHMHGFDISYQGFAEGAQGPFISREEALPRDTIPFRFSTKNRYSFVSNNPGSWIAHCHIEGHLAQGFAMVFNVLGTDGVGTIPPDPTKRCPSATELLPPTTTTTTMTTTTTITTNADEQNADGAFGSTAPLVLFGLLLLWQSSM